MLESSIERSIARHCKLRGWLYLKLRPASGRGYPDRTILLPGGYVWFVELKKPGGIVSPHQRKWRERLENQGFRYSVIYSIEEFLKIAETLY